MQTAVKSASPLGNLLNISCFFPLQFLSQLLSIFRFSTEYCVAWSRIFVFTKIVASWPVKTSRAVTTPGCIQRFGGFLASKHNLPDFASFCEGVRLTDCNLYPISFENSSRASFDLSALDYVLLSMRDAVCSFTLPAVFRDGS